MYVLGIETSCDETSVSVVRDGRHVLSNIVASSLHFHKKYGGVVPEIAFRRQLETIVQVADSAVRQAGILPRRLGLVSVTEGPGLLGSLLVGISFAKAVSVGWQIPLIGVNHLHSHIYAAFLDSAPARLPFVALVVSGGHTSLFYVEDFHKVRLLGATLDDACGEAFDKVAKILGLGYPGGPLIEKAALKGSAEKIKLNCSGTRNQLDFSFSGIKTAVLYYVQRHAPCAMHPASKRTTHSAQRTAHSADIAASFQEAAIGVLIKKSFLACRHEKVSRLVVGGGVIANSRLRDRFLAESRKGGVAVYFPTKVLSMDNAAMVAGLGYQLFKKGIRSGLTLNAAQ